MPVNLVSEEELRAALSPYRVDPETFEAGIQSRLGAAETLLAESWAAFSPFSRSAAGFLPLAILSGCKAAPVAAKAAPTGGLYKLLSYLAFPAITLVILLGAAIFSALRIRTLQGENPEAGVDSQEDFDEAVRQWWRLNQWGALSVLVITLILSMVGATALLFLMYVISFGILLYVLASFAKLGLGNRQITASSCGLGLVFLGQAAGISGIGDQEIHFLDQRMVAVVFFGGAFILLALSHVGSPFPRWRQERFKQTRQQLGAGFSAIRYVIAGVFAVPVVILMAWMINPLLWPATPSRIKHYVESFNKAPHETVSWCRWEIVASWAIQSKLDPNLSQPRRLLAREISGNQNPFILGNALRVGLLSRDQLGQLRDYEERKRDIVAEPRAGLKPQVITSIEQNDWIVRAAVLRNALSPRERDLLEQRLLVTFENLFENQYVKLSELLRVTELLEVLDRPVNRDRYRERVHDLLRKFHTKHGGGFQLAGGFKTYLIWPAGSWNRQPGALEPTASAVELMEIYGIPEGLDLNWVRSFLRPSFFYRMGDDKWVAAATLDRLNHLPGVTQPTWLHVLYYERTLLAAAVLVGLCFYATLCSPNSRHAPAPL